MQGMTRKVYFLLTWAMIELLVGWPTGRVFGYTAHAHADADAVQPAKPFLQPTLKEPSLVLTGHTFQVTSLALNPNGSILASGSCAKGEWSRFNPFGIICVEGEILLWDTTSGQQISQALTGHLSAINKLAFSSEGSLLASAGCGRRAPEAVDYCIQGEVILWKIDWRQKLVQPLAAHKDVPNGLAFSPDRMLVASAGCKVPQPNPCSQDELWLWWITSQNPPANVLTANVKRVSSLAFSPDSKLLAIGHCSRADVSTYCAQARILLWDVNAARPSGELAEEGFGTITSLAFSQDGKSLVAATYDGKVGQWDVATQKPIDNSFFSTAQPDQPSISSVLSSDGQRYTNGSSLWNTGQRQKLGSLVGVTWPKTHRERYWWTPIVPTAISADGKRVAVGGCAEATEGLQGAIDCRQGRIWVWDVP